MAVKIGTAANYLDLLEQFRAFITGPDMGAQAWTQMAYDTQADGIGKDLYLRGPGLAGDDQIFIQLQTYFSALGDYFNIRVNGASAYNADAVPKYNGQPGHDAGRISIMLWNQAIPFWFVANGRRFIIVAKVSTVYQSMHAGFILPYGLPSEYPYPVAIGGQYEGNVRWSNTGNLHCGFTNPALTLKLRTPGGDWLPFENKYDGSGSQPSDRTITNVFPTRALPNPRPSIDGTHTLDPLVLHTSLYDKNVYGEFQGVKRISGFGNASENVVTVDGVQYLVVQDGFRTGSGNYFAVALE